MALGAEVVDLIGLHLLDDPDQVGAVGEVAVVAGELWGLSLLTPSCGFKAVVYLQAATAVLFHRSRKHAENH